MRACEARDYRRRSVPLPILERFLHVDPAKVRVVPLGVDDRFLEAGARAVWRAARPYLLYVGNHRKLQRFANPVRSVDGARGRVCPGELYVTGHDDFGGELQRRSTQLRTIVALGDISTERLASYYAGAAALISPAWREGFGLPMLEAMAMGCPVVAAAEAVPGVLAPAAWTFPAGNAARLHATVMDLLADEGRRDRFVNLGREIARSLTWDRCARATADVYREVLEPWGLSDSSRSRCWSR